MRKEIRGLKNELIGYLEESGHRTNAINVRGTCIGYFDRKTNETRLLNGQLIARGDDTRSLLRI